MCRPCPGHVHLDATAEEWLRLPQGREESAHQSPQALSLVLLNALVSTHPRLVRRRGFLEQARWVAAIAKCGDARTGAGRLLSKGNNDLSLLNWRDAAKKSLDTHFSTIGILRPQTKANIEGTSGGQKRGVSSVRGGLSP